MKMPLIIAHGNLGILLFSILAAPAIILGISSICAGLKSRAPGVSAFGSAAGAVAAMVGVAFSAIHRFRMPIDDPMACVLYAPLVLGAVGVCVSVRKGKRPNKAPEPTPGAVTPRATEGASK